MIDYIKDRVQEKSTWMGFASILASGVMLFTPDSIDKVIEGLLFVFGVTNIFKKEK